MNLSIIIPVYNEQEIILEKLKRLININSQNVQIIVSDGGSSDYTVSLAKSCVKTVLTSKKGRSCQMNAGADVATGDFLLFLHIDSILPDHYFESLGNINIETYSWGRFDIQFTNNNILFSIIAFMMNIRSRFTGVATGDQAIFMTRQAYDRAGGFPEIELMEDVAMCKKLREFTRPICLREKVVTSSRRWEEKGIFKTIALMWILRLAYFLRIKPAILGKLYG